MYYSQADFLFCLKNYDYSGGVMTLILILAAALAIVYGVMALHLYYGFKKKFSL
jgi:hypothetical protein